jgi:hypothetical protein
MEAGARLRRRRRRRCQRLCHAFGQDAQPICCERGARCSGCRRAGLNGGRGARSGSAADGGPCTETGWLNVARLADRASTSQITDMSTPLLGRFSHPTAADPMFSPSAAQRPRGRAECTGQNSKVAMRNPRANAVPIDASGIRMRSQRSVGVSARTRRAAEFILMRRMPRSGFGRTRPRSVGGGEAARRQAASPINDPRH